MSIEIAPITETLLPEVKALNERLDRACAPREFRFPENLPRWPKRKDQRLYEEYFAVLEDDIVRGCYILRRQDFSFYGAIRTIGFWHWPISEGLINNCYSWSLVSMLKTVLRAEPVLYGLAPTDRMKRILATLGWITYSVPFYFKLNRHGRCLRGIRALRGTKTRELMLDIAAKTGIGQLGLMILQAARAKHDLLIERADVVQEFSDWADELWNDCKGRYAMIGVRDCKTLNMMYPPGGERFLRYKVSHAGDVVGWAVLLDTQMSENKYFGNLRVGSIVDCLASPENASAVARAATAALENRGVDLIVSNQSHQAWCGALADAGFLKGPSNFPFLASPELVTLLHPLPAAMPQSHITRGDGDGPIHL